ncbi:hypothetical protein E2562_015014 [Oryza meyeriana var. granulata]|uniref:Uncharacterized protein n=1 Tax=Oryza meyeriana var. granulata TaxID=110450 RepID=A0A6G1EKK7_9ORYZ|nr:hypothetical protein E2562_015014 [Oryza meyeriana var. granulata]
MAGPYAPQLTRWRAAVGGGVRDFVEHEGKLLALSPEDYYRSSSDVATATREEDDDRRERVLMGGRLYPVADETTVRRGGRTLRCVEFCPEPGVEPLRLTVTKATATAGLEKKQEVAEVVAPDGAVRPLGCGGYYPDRNAGTVQHVVEVEGEREAFVLLVSVRGELARIVRVQRLS